MIVKFISQHSTGCYFDFIEKWVLILKKRINNLKINFFSKNNFITL
jgi:hypothetical protein